MPDKPVLIIDGHLDMAFNALFYRRDLTQPVHVLREREDAALFSQASQLTKTLWKDVRDSRTSATR